MSLLKEGAVGVLHRAFVALTGRGVGEVSEQTYKERLSVDDCTHASDFVWRAESFVNALGGRVGVAVVSWVEGECLSLAVLNSSKASSDQRVWSLDVLAGAITDYCSRVDGISFARERRVMSVWQDWRGEACWVLNYEKGNQVCIFMPGLDFPAMDEVLSILRASERRFCVLLRSPALRGEEVAW